jgi:hypothetical protein
MEINVSEITLERALDRCLTFLRGVGTDVRAFRLMTGVGYTAQIHKAGWDLALAASGYQAPVVQSAATPEALAAIRTLDAEDGPLLSRLDASLRFNHPAQAAFVVGELRAATGVNAVINVHTLLTRLGQLGGPDRAAQREDDLAALATLRARGLDEAALERLRALVSLAQTSPELIDVAPPDPELRQRQFAVYQWFFEWSRLARNVIKDTRTLRRLGLTAATSRNSAAPTDDNLSDDPDQL